MKDVLMKRYDNSIDGQMARPLFRLTDGILGKMYVKSLPDWASNILPDADHPASPHTA